MRTQTRRERDAERKHRTRANMTSSQNMMTLGVVRTFCIRSIVVFSCCACSAVARSSIQLVPPLVVRSGSRSQGVFQRGHSIGLSPARSAARPTDLSSQESAAPTRAAPALWAKRPGARPTTIGRLSPARSAASHIGVFPRGICTSLETLVSIRSSPGGTVPTDRSQFRSFCALSFSDRPRCVC